MDGEPRPPGDEPAEMHAFEVGHRAGAPDRREVALVGVVERAGVGASHPLADRARRVAAHLHRDRRDAGEDMGAAVGLADADHVADREHLGVARHREVRLDEEALGAIGLDARALRQQPRQRRRDNAGGPDDGARVDALGRVVGALDGDARRVDVDDRLLEAHGDAQALERALGLRRQRRWEGREDAVDRLDEQDARLRHVDRAEVAANVARDLRDLAGHLDAGGAGADDHEGQVGRPVRRVGLDLGQLEGAEDLAADGQRALQRLELRGVVLPLVVTEVRVQRAARHDERVVGQRLGHEVVVVTARSSTRRASRSTSTTSPRSTRTLGWWRKMRRSG